SRETSSSVTRGYVLSVDWGPGQSLIPKRRRRPAPTRVGAGRTRRLRCVPSRPSAFDEVAWSALRHDHDVAIRLCAVGLRGQAGGQDLVVHHLALEGRHRLQLLALSGLLHPIGGGARKG